MFKDQLPKPEKPLTLEILKESIKNIHKIAQNNPKNQANIDDTGFFTPDNYYQVINNLKRNTLLVNEQLINEQGLKIIPFSLGIDSDNKLSLFIHPFLIYQDPATQTAILESIAPHYTDLKERIVFTDINFQDLSPKIHPFLSSKLQEIKEAFSPSQKS